MRPVARLFAGDPGVVAQTQCTSSLRRRIWPSSNRFSRSSATKSTSRFRRLRLAIRVPSSEFCPYGERPQGGYPRLMPLTIRTMKRAAYQDCCAPHFGLASNAYAHFTSPIRRYPDLMVHRMVKSCFWQDPRNLGRRKRHGGDCHDVGSAGANGGGGPHGRIARAQLDELLETRIGEEAQGLISGVMSSGFFVRLDDTSEGFVSLRGRDEYYVLNAARRTLTGSDSGSVYRLGMRVRIRIAAVSPYERRADFILLESKRRGVRR